MYTPCIKGPLVSSEIFSNTSKVEHAVDLLKAIEFSDGGLESAGGLPSTKGVGLLEVPCCCRLNDQQ